MEVTQIAELYERTTGEIGKVLAGQEELVEGVVLALFCEGHVLIEGVPGLGKTLLVNTLGRVIDCGFKRVQFTPDLMPSDLTGHSMFHLGEQRFEFIPGPIFTNLLLADEINRAPAKTQSALLEAMQELQVTIDGHSHRLPRPFFTMATQNPLEQEGTYPLPEAQLDRFMFKLLVDYPSPDAERRILRDCTEGKNSRNLDNYNLQPVLSTANIQEIQQSLNSVIVEPSLINYIANIVSRTRDWHSVSVGASPRAGVNLLQAARSMAASEGRNFVAPDDVKSLAPWVLRHRIRIRADAEIEGATADDAIQEILATVEAPRK
ncbi:MAG TPA: magnesium chelatase [Planctomycetaceae bacterium]|jgi:MoxR-like ATPase|nr:magnesium chelatase [Planctomycetaceae bacterium]